MWSISPQQSPHKRKVSRRKTCSLHTNQKELNKRMSVHNLNPLWTLILVPATGLEPVRILLRGILSPLCLPIPPHRRRIWITPLTNVRGAMVTRTRIELVLPPWKGGVLTAWPPGRLVAEIGLEPTTLRVWTECSSQLSYSAISAEIQPYYYTIYLSFCQ